MSTLSRRRFTVLFSAAGLAAPFVARAEAGYPSRPIRLIVPWPPAGGVDVFGRTIQSRLGAALGQPIVIENIGGASGRVGTQAAARSAADGYTVLLANDTFAATEALPATGLTPQRAELTPVTLAISAPQAVFTHPRSGIRTLQDYVAAARERRDRLNVGVPGIASSQHLTSELLLRAAGDLRVTHVPYRGGGPLLQDLLNGTLDAGVVTFSAAAEHARSGQLVALGVTSATRPTSFPDVPTATETVAPGFVQATWMGLFVRKGTPEPIRERLHGAVVAALRDVTVAERLGGLGFDPVGADGAEFAKLIDRTIATFSEIATERGIAAGG